MIKDYKFIKKKRISVWNFYFKHLLKLEQSKKIILPKYNFDNNENASHIFYFFTKRNQRDKLLFFLKANKIKATFHYLPLCMSPFFKNYQLSKNLVSESISKEIIRLPIYPQLSKKQQRYVISKIYKFFNQ